MKYCGSNFNAFKQKIRLLNDDFVNDDNDLDKDLDLDDDDNNDDTIIFS